MHGGDGGWMLDAVYGESQQRAVWLPYNGMLTTHAIASSIKDGRRL